MKNLKGYKAVPLLTGVIIAFIGFLFFVFVKDEKILRIGLILIIASLIIAVYGFIKFSKNFSKHIKKY